MRISRLLIENVRNIAQAELEPVAGINVLAGPNGSGKTTILEAIHLAGSGKSFRSRKAETLIRRGSPSLTVFAGVEGKLGAHRLGVRKGLDETDGRLQVDGRKTRSAAELAAILPIQLITPESSELVTGGPAVRRAFLDWGLFHVEHSFQPVWIGYRTALKQRNAALRVGHELAGWEAQLAEHGEAINRWRVRYVEELSGAVALIGAQLAAEISVQVGYAQGWARDVPLRAALEASRERDKEMGFTGPGVHRGDMKIMVADSRASAAETLSRGQIKVVAYTLKLAQTALMMEKCGFTPVVLLDDLPAELDLERRSSVVQVLAAMNPQMFVTTVDEALIPAVAPRTVFHVKQGRVAKVV